MCWRRGDRCGIEPTVKGQRSPSLSPPPAGCRTLLGPRSPACASAATPSELIGPTRCEDQSIGSSGRKWRKIAPRRTLKCHRLAKRHQIGLGAPRVCEPVGRREKCAGPVSTRRLRPLRVMRGLPIESVVPRINLRASPDTAPLRSATSRRRCNKRRATAPSSSPDQTAAAPARPRKPLRSRSNRDARAPAPKQSEPGGPRRQSPARSAATTAVDRSSRGGTWLPGKRSGHSRLRGAGCGSRTLRPERNCASVGGRGL